MWAAMPRLLGGGNTPVAGGTVHSRRRDQPFGRWYHACEAAGSPLWAAVSRLLGGGITPVAGGAVLSRWRDHPRGQRYNAC